MKKFLIFLLCILVIGGGTAMVLVSLHSKQATSGSLLSCAVSTGGGMLGGYRSVSLKQADSGALLTVEAKETHADRAVTTVYTVEDDALEQIAALVRTHRLYAASKRPYSKIQVLDGETTTLSFTFAGASFRVSGEQVLNRTMTNGFRAVRAYLESLAQGEGVTTTEPQTATLYLKSGYTYQFLVESAFDGKLDAVLSQEHEVSAYRNSGIVLAAGQTLETAEAPLTAQAEAGSIVYLPADRQIVLLYTDAVFDEAVFLLARAEYGLTENDPHILAMEGAYRLYFN